jgi:hypothetical protein
MSGNSEGCRFGADAAPDIGVAGNLGRCSSGPGVLVVAAVPSPAAGGSSPPLVRADLGLPGRLCWPSAPCCSPRRFRRRGCGDGRWPLRLGRPRPESRRSTPRARRRLPRAERRDPGPLPDPSGMSARRSSSSAKEPVALTSSTLAPIDLPTPAVRCSATPISAVTSCGWAAMARAAFVGDASTEWVATGQDHQVGVLIQPPRRCQWPGACQHSPPPEWRGRMLAPVRWPERPAISRGAWQRRWPSSRLASRRVGRWD